MSVPLISIAKKLDSLKRTSSATYHDRWEKATHILYRSCEFV